MPFKRSLCRYSVITDRYYDLEEEDLSVLMADVHEVFMI